MVGRSVQGFLLGSIILLHVAVARGDDSYAGHPLVPVLEMARDIYQNMQDNIWDYTCVLTKRERVGGRLYKNETIFVKIRHEVKEGGRTTEPFSVYLRFLHPAKLKDREVLFVEGTHNERVIVRNGGTRFEFVTTSIALDSPAAQQRNRYPLTEIGMMNLTRRLIEQGQRELEYDDIDVKTVPGARINERPCTLIQVTHKTRRDSVPYQFVRILIDDQLRLPVHYASYDWPEEEGGEPRLLERYTYTHIKLNVGLSDWDFDHRNERYRFLKSFKP